MKHLKSLIIPLALLIGIGLLTFALPVFAINFPTSLDSWSVINPNAPMNNPSHPERHDEESDAIEALQAKVGVDSSAVTTSHDYKLSLITGSNKAIGGSSTTSCSNLQTDGSSVVSCNSTDYLEETELDTESELEAQLTDATNVIVNTEIDTFSELNALVADKTLINEEDNVEFDGDVDVTGTLKRGNVDVTYKYMTVVLYEKSTDISDGNPFGDLEVQFDGTIKSIHINHDTAGAGGTTDVDVLIGGTSVFTTNVTVDATETSSRTAAAASVIDTGNDDFTAGDIITFDVTDNASTAAQGLKVNFVIEATNTP